MAGRENSMCQKLDAGEHGIFRGTNSNLNSLPNEKTHMKSLTWSCVLVIPRAKGAKWPSWLLEGSASMLGSQRRYGGGCGGKEAHFLGLVLSELFALWTIKGSECVTDCSGLRWIQMSILA